MSAARTHVRAANSTISSWRGLTHPGLDFILIAALTTYVVFGPFQTYPLPGWVDPGIYQGYFVNFANLIERFGPTYNSNRFVFTLLGRALHSLLPPSEAHIVLVVILHAPALLFLRMLLRPAVGGLPTWIALVVFGLSPLTVGGVSLGYVDGAVVMFLLGAIAFSFKGLRAKAGSGAFLVSGAFGTLAFYTHPFSGLTLAIALSTAAMVYRTAVAHRLRTLMAAWMGAFVLITVSYGLISYSLFGTPNFLTPAVTTVKNIVIGRWAVAYRIDPSEWIFGATRLWVVGFIGLLCVGVGLRAHLWCGDREDRVDERNAFLRWASLTLIVTLIANVLLDAIGLTSILQHTFYSSYLSLTLFPAYAALLGEVLRKAGKVSGGALFLVAGTIMAAGPYLLLEAGDTFDPDSPVYGRVLVACTLIFAAFMMAMPYFKGANFHRFLNAGMGGLLVTIVPALLIVNSDTRQVYRTPGYDFGDAYRLAHEAVAFINPAIERRDVLFWFNRDQYNREVNTPNPWHIPMYGTYPLSFSGRRYELNLLDTINAFYLWDRSRLNDNFPWIGEEDAKRLLGRNRPASIVLLSHAREDILRAESALHGIGLETAVRDWREIAAGSLRLQVWIIDLL